MEASSSNVIADCDMDNDLVELREIFGSQFTLKDIASVYFQSRQDKNSAAETLCSLHGSTSNDITADMLAAENAAGVILTSGLDSMKLLSSDFPCGNLPDDASFDGEKKSKELKSKKCSASMGSVSCVIGKEYSKTRPFKNNVLEGKKPVKLFYEDIPVSELWSEENPSATTMRNGPTKTDVEEFLFKMLGEGFQLGMPVIREVLGFCGYDMQKSIDKLLDLSNASSGKCGGRAAENSTGKCSDHEYVSLQEQMQKLDSAKSAEAGLRQTKLTGSSESKNDRINREKEVLQALFDVPDRTEEAPKRTRLVRAVKKPKAFSKLVFEPPVDPPREKRPSPKLEALTIEDDDDNSYDVLRTAVKEYWITMKEYYKAAVDAYIKGDHARANVLLEQGQFFNKKARESDDKSCQKLVETSDAEVMYLKLHGSQPKEALSLLRLHLSSISGIPSIRYLRVIMESDDEDSSTVARRRRLILKQLDKESIKWNDESDGKAIIIQVDEIDPKRLSFVKKQEPGDGPKAGSVGYYF